MHDTTSVSYFIRHTTCGPRPGRTDEKAQVARASAGDSESTNRLITTHLPGIVQIAKEFRGRGLPFDDLIAEGCVGFIKAIHRYRAVNGTLFMTYASFWIRKEILSAITDQPHVVHVPRYAREHGFKRLRPLWLDAPKNADGDLCLAECLRHPDPLPSETVAENEQVLWLRREVLRLAPREQVVIVWRFGLDAQPTRTLNEIARCLGVSKERVRQIEVAALQDLREGFADRDRRLGLRRASLRLQSWAGNSEFVLRGPDGPGSRRSMADAPNKATAAALQHDCARKS